MLNAIEFTGEVLSQDPIKKIDWLGKLVNELQQKIVFSEQEAMKFKGEANILANKLDEVFERLQSLQSELADAENKVSALMNEKRGSRNIILLYFSCFRLLKLNTVHELMERNFRKKNIVLFLRETFTKTSLSFATLVKV